MSLTKYAGFDPTEPTLAEIRQPQPEFCFPFWEHRSALDGEECLKLKNAGLSWREVGIEMAKRMKRTMPFWSNAALEAAKKFKRQQ